MRNFNEIVSSVNRLRHDIKAEAIIADVIENGLSSSDVVVYPEGLFRRRFNQDIPNAEVKKLEKKSLVSFIVFPVFASSDAEVHSIFVILLTPSISA